MHCANPKCRRESHYLRDGRLYCIDEVQQSTGRTQARFIWLCSACAPSFVIETWRPAGEQLRFSPAAAPDLHAHPDDPLTQRGQDSSRENHLPPRRPVAPHTEAPRRRYAAAGAKWN